MLKAIVSALLFLALVPSAYSATTKTTFTCHLNPQQFSQDFSITTLSFTLAQTGTQVTYVAGSIASVPPTPAFALIDSDTQIASDLEGAPATDLNGDLIILGQDKSTQMAMMLSLDATFSESPMRRADLDLYSTIHPDGQKEAHLLCIQSAL